MSTELELFKATVNHEPHDGFLYKAGFTPDLHRRLLTRLNIREEELADHLGFFSPVNVQPTPLREIREQDVAPFYDDMEIPEGSFFNSFGVLKVPGSMYHFTRFVSPLRNRTTLKEVEAFPFLSPEDYSEEGIAELARKAHRQGKAAMCFCGHLYETAWQIRGYEQFLMDMAVNPEICEYIFDRIFEKNLKIAAAAARAGVDMLSTGDDVANQNALMFAPEMWRKYIKFRWAKVYEAVRSIKPDIQIWYHSDGNITDIIPELIDIGVTILNPLQPECLDIYRLKKEYGKHLVFDGTVGTQTTMPFGTPEDVRRVIRDRKEKLGRDGALILSPTHVLEPEVPIENIIAFVDACREG
jgi:uroporphyrinogen decarboxylase